MDEKRLKKAKEKIISSAPIEEVVRGTFREVYLECIRKKCKCHKAKKYRHGPFYRISYGKEKKIHTIYIPKDKKEQAKRYTDNYKKLRDAIEKISEINIKLMKLKNGRKK